MEPTHETRDSDMYRNQLGLTRTTLIMRPGDAGLTDRDLSQWNQHTRLMHRLEPAVLDTSGSYYERSLSPGQPEARIARPTA
jgi:hypothetical protein